MHSLAMSTHDTHPTDDDDDLVELQCPDCFERFFVARWMVKPQETKGITDPEVLCEACGRKRSKREEEERMYLQHLLAKTIKRIHEHGPDKVDPATRRHLTIHGFSKQLRLAEEAFAKAAAGAQPRVKNHKPRTQEG